MKTKIKKLQIARFISQLIFLFLLPGLFTLSFSQIGKFYSSIIKGNFSLVSLLASLTAAIATLLASIIFGRFFCGWMCSFGFMNDFLYTLSSKVFKFKFKVDEETDKILKYVKYVVLGLIIILVWTLGASSLNNLNPWNAFAQITNFKTAIFQYTLGFIILAIIAIGCMFIERFFCRYLCPLGAIFSLVSKFRLFKISKPNDKCGKCRLCTNACSMGIPLYKTSKVTSGECIMCLKCVETCPRKNTQLNVAGENINPALASSVAIAAFAGMYGATTVANNIVNKNNASSISSSIPTSKGQYKDGTYTGTGTGFRPNLKVSVTVKNGNISSIEIVSNNDTPDYFDQAANTVPDEIIKAQSTNVDAVSGATRSSNGIMEAVSNALQNAKSGSSSSSSDATNNSTASNNESSSSTDENSSNNESSSTEASESNNNSSTTTNGATYKDGTYTGTGTGFRPGLQVSVTVKNSKISNIEIVSDNETPRFFDEASSTVTNEIIQAQSTNVDAVSGATRSSNGIMQAVSNALKNAM